MAPLRSRRAALGALGAVVTVGLSGCSLGEDHPELLVFNQRKESVTASISMRRVGDDFEVYAETFRLAAEENVQRQVDLSTDLHRITTDVEGGPDASHEWTPGGEGCCVEVHLGADAIEYGVRAY